jgi:hypothetical protein
LVGRGLEARSTELAGTVAGTEGQLAQRREANAAAEVALAECRDRLERAQAELSRLGSARDPAYEAIWGR